MTDVLREMHTPQGRTLSPDACQVLRWSVTETDPPSQGWLAGWQKVLAMLGAQDVAPVCSATQPG